MKYISRPEPSVLRRPMFVQPQLVVWSFGLAWPVVQLRQRCCRCGTAWQPTVICGCQLLRSGLFRCAMSLLPAPHLRHALRMSWDRSHKGRNCARLLVLPSETRELRGESGLWSPGFLWADLATCFLSWGEETYSLFLNVHFCFLKLVIQRRLI